MNKNRKKILAREFLFLLGSIILFLIIVGIWSWRYEVNSDNYWESKKELNEMIESDNVSYRVKVFHYLNQDFPELRNELKNINEFVERISQDDVSELYYNKIYDKGLITKDINHFRTKLKSDKKFKTQSKKYEKLKAKIDNRSSSIFSSMDDDEVFGLGVIILILVFGLRYLIYATKWSIEQLKENN